MFAARGTRDPDGGEEAIADEGLRASLAARGRALNVRIALVTVVATAVAYFVP